MKLNLTADDLKETKYDTFYRDFIGKTFDINGDYLIPDYEEFQGKDMGFIITSVILPLKIGEKVYIHNTKGPFYYDKFPNSKTSLPVGYAAYNSAAVANQVIGFLRIRKDVLQAMDTLKKALSYHV